MKAAHKAAFDKLTEHVNKSIISVGNVERKSMLRERYLAYILQNSPDCYYPDYKPDNLKSKLVKHAVWKFNAVLAAKLRKRVCVLIRHQNGGSNRSGI